jgi:hypothetical protein
MRQQVRAIGNQIRAENGVQQAIAAFHQHLNIMSGKTSLLYDLSVVGAGLP